MGDIAPVAVGDRKAARVAVACRRAGDDHLLVEFGDEEYDLRLNFIAQAVARNLRAIRVPGVVDLAPGFRSVIVRYNAAEVSFAELSAAVNEAYMNLPPLESVTIPSRLIHLPIAFDDSRSREAIQRYVRTVRSDAPNTMGDTNVDYCVRYNGLDDREEFYESILQTEWWNAFTGFYPGLPFMFPLDPRYLVLAPKYNPSRTWTPEGSVGLGGPCVGPYPVDSPGGYQLIGRTMKLLDLEGAIPSFAGRPILIDPGDRVQFERVEEAELDRYREGAKRGEYTYRIEASTFVVGDYLRFLQSIDSEASARRSRIRAATSICPLP